MKKSPGADCLDILSVFLGQFIVYTGEKHERMFDIFGEYLCELDAEIVYSDELPFHIRAFVVPKMDGGYTIVVNLKLNDESRQRAVEHELRHIFQNDAESLLPVILIEKGALENPAPEQRKKAPAE